MYGEDAAMLPRVRFGKTNLQVTRIGLGGYPFGGLNRARGWDPFTPEGRKVAIGTIRAALDAGINYIDTAPSYGEGNSESIIGEATQGLRDRFALASKVGYWGDAKPADMTASVEASLKRLRTDVIDVMQFHGGMYTQEEVDRILRGGLLEALIAQREKGNIRFIGFTVEEPWTARPLIASGQFDVMQVRYNLIYQSASEHVLNEAREKDMGVCLMRPLTSGIFQRLASYIAPQWKEDELYEVALKFVLSDSRVHVANLGMRWPDEVKRNVALAESFVPAFDMADLPRGTAAIYKTDDETNAAG
jgi:aryl-alcohol dehydrogenase-like predicted oxidoreductase